MIAGAPGAFAYEVIARSEAVDSTHLNVEANAFMPHAERRNNPAAHSAKCTRLRGQLLSGEFATGSFVQFRLPIV